MTCPLCHRRPCGVPGCPMLARTNGDTCWRHANPAQVAAARENANHRRRRAGRRRPVQEPPVWATDPGAARKECGDV